MDSMEQSAALNSAEQTHDQLFLSSPRTVILPVLTRRRHSLTFRETVQSQVVARSSDGLPRLPKWQEQSDIRLFSNSKSS